MNFAGYGEIEELDSPEDDALWIRQSDVSSMDLCPARAGYLRSGQAVQVPSEAMSFGTMMHTYAEHRLTEGFGDVIPKSQFEEWWVANVKRDGFDLYELAEPDRIATSLDEALVAAAAWDREVYPNLTYAEATESVLLEEKMEAPLGISPISGRGVWVHGTPDVTDLKTPTIDDWKTAARGWKTSKAHATGQASTYSFLVAANYGVSIDTFGYWVWDRKAYQWELHVTTRTPAQIDAFMRHMWMRALEIDAGAFPFTPWQSQWGEYKRGWHCGVKYCAAWDVCEGKHLADDVWEEQEIDIRSGWELT